MTEDSSAVLPDETQSSSAETVLRGTVLTLTTVGGHGVPTALHTAQCRTCSNTSSLGEDTVRPPAVWAVQHTREHPRHRHYWLTTRQRWRVEATTEPPATRDDSTPAGTVEPAPEPLPGTGADTTNSAHRQNATGGRHASPRPARHGTPLRRGWNAVTRQAGPLYLALMCTAMGAVLLAARSMGKG